MAGRKLTKYERMWRTRRMNAKLKKSQAALLATAEKKMATFGGVGPMRTSSKRLKANAKMNQAFDLAGEAIKQSLYGDRVGSKMLAPPETFIVVTDSMGRGVMVKIDDVLRAAAAIKQTGYVE